MKRSPAWRFWEILPGALIWSGLILPVIFSFAWPSIVAIYIIIFDLYWLFRGLNMSKYLISTYRKMKRAERTDFAKKLKDLPKDDPIIINHEELIHTVIFATFGEELDTLLPSVESVIEADWPNQKKMIVLAGEERDRERLWRIGNYLKREYADKIFDVFISEHPDGIVGEVRGKGAGSAWAGKLLTEYFEKKKISEEKILIHIADADSRFHKKYFNYVAYEFVTNPNRHRRSFQPIPIYSNNIWHTTPVSRVSAWGSSFWQMIEASRPWRLINFSTHSYSLKMLREMGYWSVDVVNEDSRQFWNAYFAFDGEHETVPIYLPIYMDAVIADDLWTNLKNQYYQKRRWAYGIENFPFIMTQAIKNKCIPWTDKGIKILRMIEGTYSLATSSIYLAFIGWLPLIFSSQLRETVLAYNFPLVARTILSLSWIGILASIYVTLYFMPPKPKSVKRGRYSVIVLDWVILPITALFFSSFPALESTTRLMLGKYLGFWVTPKKSVSGDK